MGEFRNKFDASENKNEELRAELEGLKKERHDWGRKDVEILRDENQEYQRTVKDLKRKLADNSPRNPLVCESENGSEDQKLMLKLKENQCMLLEDMLAATKNQLAECKDQ